MRVPARFVKCAKCGRLIIVDSNNTQGKCTKECREGK